MEQQGESAQGPQDTGNLAILVPAPCLAIRVCVAISITLSFLIFCDPFVDEFLVWLKKHKLQAYCAPLEEVILISTLDLVLTITLSKEGFDDLQSLTLLTTEEIDELATAIGMKQGHKMKFPVLIQQAREQMEELEEERRREKEKQRREDTREEEELEEKRRREKEELEEERRREKEELEEERLEERQRAKELATLEADRILAKARGTQQLGEDTEEGEISAKESSNLKSKPEQGGPKPATITAETKSKTQLNLLPPHKLFGAFISHKKAS